MATRQAGRINRRINWLRRIGSWAWRYWLRRIGSWAWRYWLRFASWSLGPVAISVIFLYEFRWTETSISTAGACLQWLGLFYIWLGVSRTRRQFDLPSLSGHVAEALREFPRPPADITGTADITMALQMSAATGSVGALGTAEPRDVVSRLDALERDYQALRATVANHHGEAQEQFRKYALELEAERTARTKDHDTLRSVLRSTATGGLDLAAYGIFVGIVATLYSTFSHEIAVHMGTATAESACVQIVTQPGLARLASR